MTKALEHVFDIDFSKENFAVPGVMVAEDVGICIRNAVDEFILKNFVDTEKTYINAIYNIINFREQGSTPYSSFMSCWAAAIMDSPLRGRHIYLSKEKCQFLIRRILEQWYKIFSSELKQKSLSNWGDFKALTVFGVKAYKYPPIMRYLFSRIKPYLVKYSGVLTYCSLNRIEKVLKRLDSIEKKNNDPNKINDMEDSEDESDEKWGGIPYNGWGGSWYGYEREMLGKDMKDISDEDAEGVSDKDAEDESHEDAKKEATDKHVHLNPWLPMNDMGFNDSWEKTATNTNRETDSGVACRTDFGDVDDVNPWVDPIGKTSYFTKANESMQQSLLNHGSHWNNDEEEGKIGVKRQREETDTR
ncbi:hypothetical protein BDQ17DRAFT_1414728 [Cyathus striatus]|nr:hypothetical protein BDQ17DRAFT_1414728 [Cyathus striatus]